MARFQDTGLIDRSCFSVCQQWISEIQDEKHSTFLLVLKKMKGLGINLTKCMQHLYEENYRTLVNKIQKELKKWDRYSKLIEKKTQNCPNVISFQPSLQT